MNKALLILDLDETLVHSTEAEPAGIPDFRAGPYSVYRRPFLNEFLSCCFTDYEVAVWTSASRTYAKEIVAMIFPEPDRIAFFWISEKCTQRRNLETHDCYAIKNLRKVNKLGYSLERVLMVDDSSEKLERHYGNHIHIKPFEGDPCDMELKFLMPYLHHIRDHPNYRRLEKRHWRTQK